MRLGLAGAALLAVAALAGCGGDDEPRLVVSAAASLEEALTECSRDFDGAEVRLSFAGSDELAAQIRRGVRPDLLAAANTRLPEELANEGLLEQQVAFATNELVLAVPASGARVRSLDGLAAPGVTLAMGAPSVPVGSYTREVLDRLPRARRAAILDNVRSEEPDVKGIVGKLTQGAVDAGFVYRSDVQATNGRLRAIPLAPRLEPSVTYGAAVVRGARERALARAYLDGMVDGACADALRRAGFGPPPR